jgi:DNA-binding PadR family transcriptional regulator
MGKGEFLGEFEQMVLLAVAQLEGRGYGVTIRQEIERRTGRDVAVGSVYSTLTRLEEKGMLRSWEGDPMPRRGGRARKHFRMEPEGVRALEESRAMMDSMWDGLELEAGEA